MSIFQPYIEIEGYVRDPGQYVAIVHFYLPSEAGVIMPVTVYTEDGQVFKGKLRLSVIITVYCPLLLAIRGRSHHAGHCLHRRWSSFQR